MTLTIILFRENTCTKPTFNVRQRFCHHTVMLTFFMTFYITFSVGAVLTVVTLEICSHFFLNIYGTINGVEINPYIESEVTVAPS